MAFSGCRGLARQARYDMEFISIPVAVQAALVSVLLGGAMAWITARASERSKATNAAQQQEITVRAQLVVDMQRELGDLRGALNSAWAREQEAARRHREEMAAADQRSRDAFQQYQAEMDDLDRRWRHLANAFMQREVVFRRLLSRSGIPEESIPEFKGFDRFEEEGGTVRDEWRRAVTPSRSPYDDGSDCG